MSSIDYQRLTFTYQPCAEQSAHAGDASDTNNVGRTAPAPHPVIVVGAGPVGLATAIDLAHQGVHVIVLDDDCTLSTGSRAICFAKRTLDIFDRLGCGDRMVQKGVCWNVGRVFLRDQEVYNFDLLPDAGHHRPAFINLQQYYVEGYLFERASELPNVEIRWKNKVSGLVQHGTPGAADASVTLTVDTPDGAYQTTARYVVAADGSRSPVRKLIGVDSHGRTFKDRFLIADVKMTANFPAERWFWFDPPFHPNQSVLLHRQPDDVWRIDFQLGWDADPEAEKTPERVIPRVQALLGPDAKFTLEWVSVYTFSCLRMDSFRHGNVLFAGDSAHGVSPFGARGANSGVQDAENLAWKLAMVLDDRAPDTLLDTYAREREFAADENILNSTRATDFITPKSPVSRVFRDAVLTLARDHAFARQLVNSGRLSVPAVLHDSTLNTTDRDTFVGRMVPGATCLDAPLSRNAQDGWLLPRLGGRFVALVFGSPASLDATALAALQAMANDRVPVMPVFVTNDATQAQGDENVWHDAQGLAAQRYDATPGTVYLVRPDQHVCARWRALDVAAIAQARERALGRPSPALATMPCAA
ncbi:3-(3-hydroxy-phenyl)propionate/3-hydroxycinnamic acid hydroxylase [Pandoraea iniqua]|uniref:3-(3-hydroxy-phenyl)propionate/3-hydroxycinnamic acid hydroxylase n=1 Tax=Pandoraea iniqua TaxID=2508288 RepID=A0A5E4SZK9_9BURK|nr:FAD-dependent oxidoreductase [Pandoraea iniqua]VVD80601.1 3-(3-hydroxy-phenyl)propionate/3-hydroxycinnamic acid hydroxylase [Pandoraea iniqua]